MTSASRALPARGAMAAAEKRAFAAPSTDQPGRLAQGPDEKLGLAGRMSGRGATNAMNSLPFRRQAPRWGGVTRAGR